MNQIESSASRSLYLILLIVLMPTSLLSDGPASETVKYNLVGLRVLKKMQYYIRGLFILSVALPQKKLSSLYP